MTSLLERFSGNRSGNMGMIFALTLLPLAAAVGLAVDFSRLSDERIVMQQSLDAGTMAAAIHFSDNGSIDDAVAEGRLVFASNCVSAGCSRGTEPAININPGVDVTASYASTAPTSIMKVAGIAEAGIKVGSQVKLVHLFEEYHFAVDRSASLAIAADDANRAAMRALSKPYFDAAGWTTNGGCSFACHEPVASNVEPYEKGKQTNFYDMAREAGIKLREDVLLDALDNALDVILERITGTHADQIKVAGYTFSDTLDSMGKPTANSTNLKTKIRNSSIRQWGSRLDLILPQLNGIIGKSGTGTSKNSPRKTLVLITDGMMTNYWNDTVDGNTSSFASMPSSLCAPFKANGVRVVVVEVKYPRVAGEPNYDANGAPYVNSISPALQACASPGYYYAADDVPQIQATLSKMSKEARQTTLAFGK